MTQVARAAPPGYVYHVLHRAVARLPLFQKDGDYEAFERVLSEALQEHPTRLLAYCLMPNHWHFVVWPQRVGELTAFTQWLTHTHTMRWHTHHHTFGSGHVYQGRFKSFQVQETSISTRWHAMLSATLCEPIWCSVPRTGAGPAYGDGSTPMPHRQFRLRTGRCPCQRIGSLTLSAAERCGT